MNCTEREALIALVNAVIAAHGEMKVRSGGAELWFGRGYHDPAKVLLWRGEHSTEMSIEEGVDAFLAVQ